MNDSKSDLFTASLVASVSLVGVWYNYTKENPAGIAISIVLAGFAIYILIVGLKNQKDPD